MAINHIKISPALHERTRGILFLALMIIVSATAQEKKQSAFVEDYLKVYGFAADKAASLAEAIPAEKYDWRPAEGVRSVKESILHIAGANYFFASMLGTSMPEGINPREFDKTVDSKEKAISTLQASVAHAKKAIANMKEETYNEEVDFFGNKMTRRQVMFVVGDHAAEHLGQLIAYARMNGITPPWSQKEN